MSGAPGGRVGRAGRHRGARTDRQQWHAPHQDAGSPLSARLRAVQHEVGRALDRASPGPVRLLSLCAGQGRDVLPVLATQGDGRRGQAQTSVVTCSSPAAAS